MASRSVIDQACGMLMALRPCTPTEAWEALVEISQHTNIKLRAVALHLVATTTGHPLPEPIRRPLALALHRHRT